MDIGAIVAHLKLDMKDFTNNLNVAKNELDSTSQKFSGIAGAGKALQGVGGMLTATITTPVLALGASAVKTGMQFEDSMAKVRALSGASGAEFEQLKQTALDMGASTVFSASECANALGYMALAGWDASQSASALSGVLNLASASGMELAQASDMVTDYLSAFGEEADQAGRMADILAYAQGNSNTSAQQLGDAFKNCAVNAKGFGQDLEMTTALLGKLADQGLKGGEAGTALNAVFRDLTANMKDGKVELNGHNIALLDAQGNYRDMTDIIGDMEGALEGLSEGQRSQVLGELLTQDSLKATGILLNTGEESIKSFDAALRNSGGTAEEMSDVMNMTLSGALKTLSSVVESNLLKVFDRLEPLLLPIIQSLIDLATWFANLPTPVLATVMAIAGILAVVAPLILIFGTLISKINDIRMAFGMLKSLGSTVNAFGGITKAVGFLKGGFISIVGVIKGTLIPALGTLWGFLLANPITLVIAGIVALVAGFIYLWNNCEAFREFWIQLWENCKQMFSDFCNAVGTFISNIPMYFQQFLDFLSGLPEQILYWLGFAIGYVVGWTLRMGQEAINAGKTFLSNVITFIKQLPGKVWTWLTDTIQRTKTWATDMKNKAKQAGTEFVNNVINFVKSLPGKIWSWLTNTIQKVNQFKTDFVNKARDSAKQFTDSIVNGVKEIPGKMLSIGSDICRGLANGVKNGLSWVKESVSNLVSGVVNGAKRALGIASPSRVFRDQVGKFIPEGTAVGITKNAKEAYNAVRSFSKNLVGMVDMPNLSASMNVSTNTMTTHALGGMNTTDLAIKSLERTMKANRAYIDYNKLETAFARGAEKVNSTIVMDKTIVGKKVAQPVKQTNDETTKRNNRLRGDI